MKIDENYRMYFPEKNIYVSEDHNWAFAAWEMAKNKKVIKPNATLFHVDGHLDDIWDGILIEGIYTAKTEEEILHATEQLKIENFIWAGFATDAIENIIYVTEKRAGYQDPFDHKYYDFKDEYMKPLKELLKRKKYDGVRLESVEDLEEFTQDKYNRKYIDDKSLILDLDLDYFNLSGSSIYPNLMNDDGIRANLTYLKNLYKWDLITVALSSHFCGGENECRHIYEIFLDVFNLDESKGVNW